MTENVISLQPEEGVSEHVGEDDQKYRYPEFAGWSGERYLKKLLRQILPLSLYRTWEIFVDHQAQGNACYLGVIRLAEMAGRNTRTVEKNLASLCAKDLLVERAERKVFRGADGRLHSQVVVIKDFRGLYTLAHDYHEWLADPGYIAPDREMMTLVAQEPQLVARVRRFENYRRLLYHRQPGPVTKPREVDGWFTAYQPEPSSASFQADHAEGAFVLKNDPIPSTLSAKDLTTSLATGSSKRRNERDSMDGGRRDLVDSIDPSLADSVEEPEPGSVVCNQKEHSEAESTTPPTSAQEAPPEVTTPPDPEMALSGPELAASFLRRIAGPFGDRSPKGSQTRLRVLLSETHRSTPAEVLPCLVRAYLVARDTRTIRAVHCSPTGQANRMPLFFALLQRFLGEEAPAWDEHGSLMEEALVSDPCLAGWWSEHQRQVHLPSLALSDDVEREALQEAEGQDKQAYLPQEAAEKELCSHRPRRLSRSDAEREVRAALARQVLWRLGGLGVVLQGATVLWEHIACGCPLYHRPRGREVCALCVPDPTWPEEALVLLRSIVQPEEEQERENTGAHAPQEEANAWDEQAPDGWENRDAAYREALQLLDTLTSLGYDVEVFLERAGTGYQIGVCDDQSEWICTCPEHIDALVAQVSQSIPGAHR